MLGQGKLTTCIQELCLKYRVEIKSARHKKDNVSSDYSDLDFFFPLPSTRMNFKSPVYGPLMAREPKLNLQKSSALDLARSLFFRQGFTEHLPSGQHVCSPGNVSEET